MKERLKVEAFFRTIKARIEEEYKALNNAPIDEYWEKLDTQE